MSLDKYIDVDFSELNNENNDKKTNDINDEINGKVFFYTTTQVAKILKEEPSTIRYWSKRFTNLLNVEISNRNKQYKKSDIEKLKFIQKLAREKGLTLKQIEDYCSKKGFHMDKIEKTIDADNPLAIKVFISAMSMEMNKQFNDMRSELLQEFQNTQNDILNSQNQLNEKIRNDVAVTVDEVLSEKMDKYNQNFKNYIDKKELEFKKKDIQIIDMLRKNMEYRKIENEKNNKSWFQRLFFKDK